MFAIQVLLNGFMSCLSQDYRRLPRQVLCPSRERHPLQPIQLGRVGSACEEESVHGFEQVKFAASSMLPVPLYLAISG